MQNKNPFAPLPNGCKSSSLIRSVPFLGQENENLRSQVEALKTRDPRDAGDIYKTFLGLHLPSGNLT